jgi:multidrug resistance protein
MLAPLLGQIMDTLAVKSDVAATAILTSYVLGFCFGPLLFAPMSEVYGRLVVYRVCTVGFLVFTVACAAAPDIALLCVFRFLAGSFGSPPQAVAGATVADVMDQSERGKAMAVVTLLTLAAPALGPVCGGFIGARWGWRAALWIVAILVSTNYLMKRSC